MMKPVHIATIRGEQLRFFRTPNDDGRPDLPWHCCDDLYRCMGLSRDLRRHFQRHVRRWRNGSQTVATADGPVTIAPHYVAQGVTGAWNEIGCANIEDEYAREGSIALKKLTAGLHGEQFLDWAAAAFKRHDDASGAPK